MVPRSAAPRRSRWQGGPRSASAPIRLRRGFSWPTAKIQTSVVGVRTIHRTAFTNNGLNRREGTYSRPLVVILCLVLAGVGLALIQSVRAERVAREQAELMIDVVDILRRSLVAAVDAETGQRGYLLTNDPSYLVDFEYAEQIWLPLLYDLQRRLGRDASREQLEAIVRLRQLAKDKLAELRLTIELTRDGDREEAIAVVTSDLGKRLMDEYRATQLPLRQTEQAMLSQAQARAEAIERRTVWMLAILAVTVTLLVLAWIWTERRAGLAERQARKVEGLERAKERSEILTRELNHRIRNLFAVVMSIVSLSGRSQADPKAMVRDIRRRIQALSLAHDASQGNVDGGPISLGHLLRTTLRPYAEPENPDRISLGGQDVELPMDAATPLGLLVHELATNALKYGALSHPSGTIRIEWRRSETGPVELTWTERMSVLDREGVPSEDDDPSDGAQGVGSAMISAVVAQLHGTIERDWRPEGLRVRLRFSI